MLSKISNNIANYLVEIGSTKEDEKVLISYGMEVGIAMLINIISTLLIGLIFSCVVECVVFLITYIPIRSFAGGYHASNHLRCYLFSVMTIILFSIALTAIPLSAMPVVSVIMCLFSIVVIAALAPVQDANKPLDSEEVSRYRKITRLLLLGQVVLITALLLLGIKSIALTASISLFLLSIMLIIGHQKNKIAQSICRVKTTTKPQMKVK